MQTYLHMESQIRNLDQIKQACFDWMRLLVQIADVKKHILLLTQKRID